MFINLNYKYLIIMELNTKYKDNYYVAKSKIHGNGCFANKLINKNQVIGTGIVIIGGFFPHITQDLGKWLNHSYTPNCFLYYRAKDNNYYIVANKNINKNDELTLNYVYTPWFINKPEKHYK